MANEKKTSRKKFRVAVSGSTVDGREISPVHLREAAENFNPDVYAARVNVEHYLSPCPSSEFSAMGDVTALSTEDITETAMIIGSLWSDAIPAPGKSLKEIVVSAPDGAVFRYDADAGALSASGMKTATLQASVSVTLDTPVVECTNLLKTAEIDVTKGGKMSGNITHSGGDFTSNGITVHTHKHGGVKGGSDSTGGPQ
ncbi:phage baseplate assembly protein V [Escherichia coli]|uniref:phage baseplate assembly protein V n=2 Tax=Escherichia coli TaxID=562 RepID=UPI001F5861FE|nr:phage baseplate assembly protein V [Escherichia coli]